VTRTPAFRGVARNYQVSLPWQELAQLRAVAFQPMLAAASSLTPFRCVAAFTVDEL